MIMHFHNHKCYIKYGLKRYVKIRSVHFYYLKFRKELGS